MDKNKIKNKLKDDPAFTLEVQNPEVEELMAQYSSDKKAETLNKLIEKCTKSRFLVPANVGENNKPIPLFIKNGEGEAFMPIYTSKAQLSKDHPSPCIVNMPFLAVNNMVANKESKLDGIAFNPFTHNLIFKKPLVEKIEAVEKARREGHPTSPTKGKTVQMTAEQYVIFERMQYEHIFLPAKMFEGGKEFMDRLADEKEKLIDELYEEAYQQKRMYPYMEEDFSVMAMQISDTLNVTRVDFPTRDMAPNCAIRAYLVWDDAASQGRYFVIDAKGDKTTELAEITEDYKRLGYGAAPVEGAELQTVLDLVKKSAEEQN